MELDSLSLFRQSTDLLIVKALELELQQLQSQLHESENQHKLLVIQLGHVEAVKVFFGTHHYLFYSIFVAVSI